MERDLSHTVTVSSLIEEYMLLGGERFMESYMEVSVKVLGEVRVYCSVYCVCVLVVHTSPVEQTIGCVKPDATIYVTRCLEVMMTLFPKQSIPHIANVSL